ncbi:hypothetical protein AB0N31_04620 [Streptomyces sp. NPDC051051]|uniref:hypothetical protein n=1 Tax=Streptomyces sp. NPDC051051 TaxID=3155666 RepID=UPI00341EDA0D
MTWPEAARTTLGCAVVCVLAYAALTLLGQDTGPVQAPVVMVLARWWWERHRDWAAGAAAGLAGSLVVFVLLGPLRAHLDRLAADSSATCAGAVTGVVVLTVGSRLRARARGAAGRSRPGAGRWTTAGGTWDHSRPGRRSGGRART